MRYVLLLLLISLVHATCEYDPLIKHKNIYVKCYNKYKLYYYKDKYTTTPLYSEENLTKEQIVSASKIGRRNNYFYSTQEYRINSGIYKHSLYQKGHLAASENMPTYYTQKQTFLYINTIPEITYVNKSNMVVLENYCRRLTYAVPWVIVRTGIQSYNSKLGNVIVPSVIFKQIITDQNTTIYAVNNDINRTNTFTVTQSELLNDLNKTIYKLSVGQ